MSTWRYRVPVSSGSTAQITGWLNLHPRVQMQRRWRQFSQTFDCLPHNKDNWYPNQPPSVRPSDSRLTINNNNTSLFVCSRRRARLSRVREFALPANMNFDLKCYKRMRVLRGRTWRRTTSSIDGKLYAVLPRQSKGKRQSRVYTRLYVRQSVQKMPKLDIKACSKSGYI